ncbi:MAG TPA: hypothetical protein VK599_11200 [Streptosporangiaceae bacterium]|nr:hypothetical protein [Streptosporangiaceae bacterium]
MSVPAPSGDDLPARLRLALTAALRARDMTAVAALRSALGAIGNAEAVPVPPAPSTADQAAARSAATGPAATGPATTGPASTRPSGGAAGRSQPPFAGSAAGLGAAEAERRRLRPAQVAAIVQAEIDERLAAAAQYERAGREDRAARLTAEAQALASAVGGPP